MAAGKKDEKADNKDAAATAEAKQKKKKMFMFIGLGVLLVLVSVGATFFVVSKMMHKGGSEGEAEAEVEEKPTATPAIYLALKPNFTVNFDVNGRQRFLQTELTLLYRDPNLQKLLEEHMPAVRNGLVMLLSRQVFDELQTAEGKEKLRGEALTVVQDIIAKETEAASEKEEKKKDDAKISGTVENVLFTQFVMQ
jgi:flagellar protein FliL